MERIFSAETKRIFLSVKTIILICFALLVGYILYESTGYCNYYLFGGESRNAFAYDYYRAVDLKKNGFKSDGDSDLRMKELNDKADKIISGNESLGLLGINSYREFRIACCEADKTLSNTVRYVDGKEIQNVYSEEEANLILEVYHEVYGTQSGFDNPKALLNGCDSDDDTVKAFSMLNAYEQSLFIDITIESGLISSYFAQEYNNQIEVTKDSLLPMLTYSQVQNVIFVIAGTLLLFLSLTVVFSLSGEKTGLDVIFSTKYGEKSRMKAHCLIALLCSLMASMISVGAVFFLPYNVWLFRNEMIRSVQVMTVFPEFIADIPYIGLLSAEFFILCIFFFVMLLNAFTISSLAKNKIIGVFLQLPMSVAEMYLLKLLLWDKKAVCIDNKYYDYLSNYTVADNALFKIILFAGIAVLSVTAFVCCCTRHSFKRRKTK